MQTANARYVYIQQIHSAKDHADLCGYKRDDARFAYVHRVSSTCILNVQQQRTYIL